MFYPKMGRVFNLLSFMKTTSNVLIADRSDTERKYLDGQVNWMMSLIICQVG
jgi:hypothetical protein